MGTSSADSATGAHMLAFRCPGAFMDTNQEERSHVMFKPVLDFNSTKRS